MTDSFRNPTTRKTLLIMMGNMYPSEMYELTRDPQLKNTDVPEWIDQTIREQCGLVIARIPRYEEKFLRRFGHTPSLIGKLAAYHEVWDNWDSLEPCAYPSPQPLRKYFDEHIDPTVKERIARANARRI